MKSYYAVSAVWGLDRGGGKVSIQCRLSVYIAASEEEALERIRNDGGREPELVGYVLISSDAVELPLDRMAESLARENGQ